MHLRTTFANTFHLEATVALTVFGIVSGLVAFAVLRYRAGRRSAPATRSENNRLEAAYALGLLVVAAWLAATAATANASLHLSSPAPLAVGVMGYQWSWRFHYPASGVTVTGGPVGTVPTLVLPAHTSVTLDVSSNDVVHSFWIPHLRFKIDAFPKHVNKVTLQTGRPGTFPGRCAEFCGLYHDRMDFNVTVVTPAAFKQWLSGPKLRVA